MYKKKPAYITLILCFVAYVSVYTGRMNISIAVPLLQTEGIVDKVTVGAISSVFFFVYAFGRMINGYIGDVINSKQLLIIGLGMAAISNILFGCFPPVIFLFILWGTNGFFQSMLWGPILKIVTTTYEKTDKQSKAVMVLSSSVGMGGIVAIMIGMFGARFGAAQVFIFPGILMLVSSVLLFFNLPNPENQDKSNVTSLKVLIANKSIRKMLFPAMAHGIIKDNLALWFPILFMEMYNTDLKSLSFYIFLMPVATFLGRLLFPMLYKQCRYDEKYAAVVAFIICAVALIPFIFFVLDLGIAAVLLAIVAITTSVINAAFLSVYPVRFKKNNQISTVAGIIDFATYLGSSIGSGIFGLMVTLLGYNSMIIVWLVLAIISVIFITTDIKLFFVRFYRFCLIFTLHMQKPL